MYFLIVSAEALPVEHTKYPSLQNIFSFQKWYAKNFVYFSHIRLVDRDFNHRTI
jgi:hypothetical protein